MWEFPPFNTKKLLKNGRLFVTPRVIRRHDRLCLRRTASKQYGCEIPHFIMKYAYANFTERAEAARILLGPRLFGWFVNRHVACDGERYFSGVARGAKGAPVD